MVTGKVCQSCYSERQFSNEVQRGIAPLSSAFAGRNIEPDYIIGELILQFGNAEHLKKVEEVIRSAEFAVDKHSQTVEEFKQKWSGLLECPIVYKKRFLSRREDTFISFGGQLNKISITDAMEVEKDFARGTLGMELLEKNKQKLEQFKFIQSLFYNEKYNNTEFCGYCGYIWTETMSSFRT